MKVLAINLPQFHAIPENDEWWGKGFTEWTNIKKENKYSGKIKPLNGNYYNMLDKSTMKWQADLCEEYGIYGMCYYHYYFNGKLLLEKPVENLLKWKDINQKFCFMWANHSWYRSWQGKKDVLIEQTYGTKEDWEKHFDYLKPFFEDERYIKINNKPLFVMFNFDCPCTKEIIDCFDIKCKECGFDGIYFVQSISNKNKIKDITLRADALLFRQPDFVLNDYLQSRNILEKIYHRITRISNKCFHSKLLIRKYNGNRLMKKAIGLISENYTDKPYFWGAYSMWDNTYRHEWRGYKITKPSKKIFQNYLKALKDDCEKRGSEFVFFNAWNEWAEGMTLEPQEKLGCYFLECIREVLQNDGVNKE